MRRRRPRPASAPAFSDQRVGRAAVNLAGRGKLGVALAGEPRGFIGKPAIDERLDLVGLGQAEPDRGAKIGDGAGAVAHLAISEPAQIERLGGVGRRGIVGIDGRGELPHGGVIFARRQRRGAVLQSGILGAGRADRPRTDGERGGKTARARETAPAEKQDGAAGSPSDYPPCPCSTKKSGKSEA